MTSRLQAIKTGLAKILPIDGIDTLLKPLLSLPLPTQKEVADMGLILSDVSVKSAIEYFRVVPGVLEQISVEELGGWVGFGMQIAQNSTASGIRYFREGPKLLQKIADPAARKSFLQLGVKWAQTNPNLALCYYQQAPSFLADVSTDSNALHMWAQHGFALTDYTLAVEYFNATPSLLKHLPMSLLPVWVDVAKKFAADKLFFAITFIRTSSEIFSKISADAASLLALINEILAVSPERAIALFTASAQTLSPLPAERIAPFLKKTLQIALVDVDIAKGLFMNTQKIIAEVGADSFLEWIDHGIALMKEGSGFRYFTLESQASKEFANHLKGGVFLSSYINVLEPFARALSGRPVILKAMDLDEGLGARPCAPTTDGHTIYLPPHIAFFEDPIQNREWYKVATAFQAGYIEFNTFWPSEERVADFMPSLSLSSFLDSFPNQTLIKRLFDIVEGARIEFLLKEEYPGLRESLIRLRESELAHQPLLSSQALRSQIVTELLAQIALAGRTIAPIPSALSETVFECCRIMGAVQSVNADVLYSMRAAKAVYDLLDDGTPSPDISKPMEAFEEKGDQIKGSGTESGKTRFTVRGDIDPKRVEKRARDLFIQEMKGAELISSKGGPETKTPAGSILVKEETVKSEDVGAPTATSGSCPSAVAGATPEWDCERDEYRPGFCRIYEKEPPVLGGEDFIANMMAEYGGIIKSIKRGFQYLAPEGVVLCKGVLEGDGIDLDRLMEQRVEAWVGRSPSGRIYTERRKKERSVAAAFLVDLSGSTQQRLSSGKSVLQIEKEALILLSHALSAIGDRFALYGFSGRSNEAVDFYILKDFNQKFTRQVDCSIGSISPLWQNRDGAAIRHTLSKLANETAQTKILVLLSDGKPLDDHYRGSYAYADVKKALSEARQLGIHPFCITVDREGAEYLPGMYGDVAYLVIDKVESLPEKLPRIYKRLTT
jgi:hypothetical protein